MRHLATLRVLRVFMESPANDHYGLDLMRATGLSSGTLYPILKRLEKDGLVVGQWEEVDASEVGRPRRKLYRLTPDGVVAARNDLQEARVSLGLSPAGGFA
jgi:DNA-binding PadR family transcriptional regulator